MENKKKWYKTWWGILAIILLFPIFLMAFLTRLIWKQNWKVQTRVIAIVLLWGAVFIGGLLPKDTNQATVVDTRCIGPDGKRIGLSPEECEKFNNAWKNKPQGSSTQASSQQQNYQIIDRSENYTVENIAVLIQSGDTNAEVIAMEVKKTCKKPCNIDIYDDRKAYDLNAQYDKMIGESTTKPGDLTAWKQTNYVYVGDHLVGSVDFETGTFNDYPFRDWYYKQLKGSN